MSHHQKIIGVIGLGRFGGSVAKNLTSMGHEVIGIDSDPKVVQSFSEILSHVVATDTTKEQNLIEAGVGSCDAVVVAIGSDIKSSIMTSLVVKDMNIGNIVAKANDPLHAKVLTKIGIENVVQPEKDMGERVAFYLNSKSFVNYLTISSQICLAEVEAPHLFVGKSLEEIKMRDNHRVSVAAIKRGEEMLVPPLSTELIQKGDILFLVGKKQNIAKLNFLN